MDSMSDEEILKLFGELVEEMTKREIIHSKNIVGDLGERFALNVYNKTPGLINLVKAGHGTANVDAIGRNGKRYSIKALTASATSPFYGMPKQVDKGVPPEQTFDFLIIVKLNRLYGLEAIYEITWEQFLNKRKWADRIKAYQLRLTNALKNEAVTKFPQPI